VITLLQHVPWTIALVAASVLVSALESETWTTRKQRLPKQYTSRSAQTSRRGRPRKFGRPSRAVTLTLPEDVLARLHAIDHDLSCAVVRAMELDTPQEPRPRAELTTYGNRAVILVPRSRALRERTGVELVPTADGRALISMDGRLSIAQLELRLHDALRDPALNKDDRALFDALVEILRNARQDQDVELRERQIIVLQRRRNGSRS
jgi:hypothetical protein